MESVNWVQLLINCICIATVIVVVGGVLYYLLTIITGRQYRHLEDAADLYAETVANVLRQRRFFSHNGLYIVLDDDIETPFSELTRKDVKARTIVTDAFKRRNLTLDEINLMDGIRYGSNIAIFGGQK